MSLFLPTTLALTPVVSVLGVLFALVSVLMMLIILVQKPKGGGLSGAFGGGGGTGSEGAFMGAKVGDFLTIVTASCFIVFVLLAMGLTWTTTPEAEAEAPVFSVEADPPTEAEVDAADPAAGDDGATPITPTVGDDPDSATANNANREPVAADMTAHDLVDDVLDAVAGEGEPAAPAGE